MQEENKGIFKRIAQIFLLNKPFLTTYFYEVQVLTRMAICSAASIFIYSLDIAKCRKICLQQIQESPLHVKNALRQRTYAGFFYALICFNISNHYRVYFNSILNNKRKNPPYEAFFLVGLHFFSDIIKTKSQMLLKTQLIFKKMPALFAYFVAKESILLFTVLGLNVSISDNLRYQLQKLIFFDLSILLGVILSQPFEVLFVSSTTTNSPSLQFFKEIKPKLQKRPGLLLKGVFQRFIVNAFICHNMVINRSAFKESILKYL